MTDETQGTAAPAAEPAAPSAPAESEQAQTTTEQQGTQDGTLEGEQAETDGSTEDTGESEDGKPKKLSRNQRYQRTISYQSAKLADQGARIAELEGRLKEYSPEGSRPPPQETGDYVADQLAKHRWEDQRSREADRLEDSRRQAADIQREMTAESNDKFFQRVEELKPRVPDFDKTIENFAKSGGNFAPHVVQAIRETGDKGVALTYHLAKNPFLANQLNNLDPLRAGIEIGRLGSELSLPKPKTQTAAPAPLNAPKGGSASPVNEKTGPEDMGSFAKWLGKQMAARKGR